MFGLSVATNFAGFAVSGEVSYRPDFPVQINTTELLQGAVGLAPWSTVTPIIIAAGPGAPASGYDLLPVTQAQVTFIRFFDQVLGASRLSFAAEIGANWVGDLPEQSVQRYGRSPTYGMGYFDPIPLPSPPLPPGEFITCEARQCAGRRRTAQHECAQLHDRRLRYRLIVGLSHPRGDSPTTTCSRA